MNRNLIDKYKLFDLYLNDNKEEICREIKQLCEKYAINFIISVDKKGSDIIKSVLPGGAIEVNEKIVSSYVNQYIDMTLDDFSIFNNKNILIFDDTARTGNTLKNVKDSLLRKVKKAVKGQNINCNFIFYCLAICKDKEKIKEKLGDKFFSFEENALEYADYYDFCIKEAQYLQQKYMVTSSDLPVFEGYLNNIDSLMKALDRYSNSLKHKKVEVYIGNKLINTELIILKDNKLKKIFGDFIGAFLCKIRYEYVKEIKKYRLVMTPWALTASINYEKLKELYMLMFPEDKIDTNEDSSDEAIRMYKRVNFFISYYIGYVLKKRLLWINAIEIEYTNNGFNQFGYEVNAHVKNTIDDSNFDIYEYLKDFSYSENTVNNTLKNYSYSKLNNYIYDKIIKKENENVQDNYLIKIESFKRYYNNSSMFEAFFMIITSLLENYSITDEIHYESETGNIVRGFKPCENSMTFLPAHKSTSIFFPALYMYYKKCQGNVEVYLENYDLFISKLENLLEFEDYFKLNLINSTDFDFLVKYFKISENDNLAEIIESKLHYTNNKELKKDQMFIMDAINMILTSADFKFK